MLVAFRTFWAGLCHLQMTSSCEGYLYCQHECDLELPWHHLPECVYEGVSNSVERGRKDSERGGTVSRVGVPEWMKRTQMDITIHLSLSLLSIRTLWPSVSRSLLPPARPPMMSWITPSSCAKINPLLGSKWTSYFWDLLSMKSFKFFSSQSEVGSVLAIFSLRYVVIFQVLISSGILFPEEWWISVKEHLLIYCGDYVICSSLLLFMPRIRLIDLIMLSQLCKLASLELRPFNCFVLNTMLWI